MKPGRRARRRNQWGRLLANRRRLASWGLLALGLGGVLMMGGCSQSLKTTELADGSQTVKVVVKDGFHPSRIEARAGKPLKIEFYRDEDPGVRSCDQEVNMPTEHVNIHLPVHESQIVEIKPQAAGDIEFQCGMHMYKGSIAFR